MTRSTYGPATGIGAPSPERSGPSRDGRGPLTAPLDIYLNDHLMGASSGCELARRIATQHAKSPAAETLIRIAEDIAEDRAALLEIMDELGVPVRRYKMYAGWLLEKAGRAKSNGFLTHRAPLSSLIELEALRLGVEGKGLMWEALRTVRGPQTEHLDRGLLADLAARAREQADTLESLRLPAAQAILSLA